MKGIVRKIKVIKVWKQAVRKDFNEILFNEVICDICFNHIQTLKLPTYEKSLNHYISNFSQLVITEIKVLKLF